MTKQLKRTEEASVKQEDAIDVIALLKKLVKAKKLILKTVLFFIILGLFVAIFSEDEYTASTTVVPQSEVKNVGGGLSGIAALAGVNIGGVGSQSSISPQLYPQIINNIHFQNELLETLITIKGQDEKITYKEYYKNVYSPGVLSTIKKFTIGLPSLIIDLFRSNSEKKETRTKGSLIQISQEDEELIELLSNQLLLNVNDKKGYIILSVSLPEAKAAAEFVQSAQELLERYVIDFKIAKSTSQLNFIKKRYKEKEIEFLKIQDRFSAYTDQNQQVNSARAKTMFMKLKSEYDLTYKVYSELAKQLETQELKVKENTPIFTIIEPVYVPIKKAKPQRALIIITWTFIGVVLSFGFVLGKTPIQYLLKELKSSNES